MKTNFETKFCRKAIQVRVEFSFRIIFFHIFSFVALIDIGLPSFYTTVKSFLSEVKFGFFRSKFERSVGFKGRRT